MQDGKRVGITEHKQNHTITENGIPCFKSKLPTAAFLIIFASVAKRRVERVSEAALCAGETVAIIDVNELPPRESYIELLSPLHIILEVNTLIWNHDREYALHDASMIESHFPMQKATS